MIVNPTCTPETGLLERDPSDLIVDSRPPVNVAVVGLGFMGTVHLNAYKRIPAARIVALCGASRLPVDGVLKGLDGNITASDTLHFGSEVKVYRRFNELLADPQVQLVDLCTPTPIHVEQSISALKAGKHVLCEKPLARTSAEAKEIAKVAQSCLGFLLPAMCVRFWPGWSLLKKIVQEKTYGDVLAARFSRVSETPAWSKETYNQRNQSGGALFDLHIHDTDFVQFLFGKPSAVFSTGIKRLGNSIDHVITQYLFPNGPTVAAEGSWLLNKGFNMSYLVLCEGATLDYSLERGENALRVLEKDCAPRVVPTAGDGYFEETRYMIECIQKSRRPAFVTVEEAVSALEICEAEEESINTARVVPIHSK